MKTKLPSMVWILAGFAPWILFRSIPGTAGILAAFAAAVALNALRLPRRNFKALELIALAYFAANLAATSIANSAFFVRYGPLASSLALAAMAWGTLLARSPFTYQYARDDWDESYWSNPEFIFVNQVLTAAWGLVFTANAAMNAAVAFLPLAPAARLWLQTVLPNAFVVLAILLCAKFPAAYTRRLMLREIASREPWKWPAPAYAHPRPEQPDRHHVAIVGAGIGGLAAGALLADRGLKVAVFESHVRPGGFCTSWSRTIQRDDQPLRYVFDAGVHDVSGLGPRGPVRLLLRRLGIESQIDWRPMAHEYALGGHRLRIPHDPDGFPRVLAERFPAEADGIRAFFNEMRLVYEESYADADPADGIPRPPSTPEAMLAYPVTRPHAFRWREIPYLQMLDHFLRDPAAKQILRALGGYLSDDDTLLAAGDMAPLLGYYFVGGF